MAVIGTFGSYGTALLGIHAAQTAMHVTGNNIGNINTTGYTRQRADQCSMYSTGAPRYQNAYNHNIGYGAMVENVSQLRDPYLDIRYRNENSALGYNEAMQNGLNQLAHILDEVGTGEDDFGMIYGKLGELKGALNDLLQYPDSTQHDDLVAAVSSTLCRLFNNASKELQEVHNNEEARLMESVKDVNNILTNIRDLNEQIRMHSICGDNALELRDARNVQIDKLSKYMKLNVTYSMEKLNDGKEIEKLSISLYDTKDPYTGKPYMLVDGIYATQLLMPEKTPQVNPAYREDLDTSKMYWDSLTKQPTHDIREARQWNPAYKEDALPYLDADGNPTNSSYRFEGPADNRVVVDNRPNPAAYKYVVDDKVVQEYQKAVADAGTDGVKLAAVQQQYYDITEIDGKYYTNNQNKAGTLYNVAANNPDAATQFNPALASSYKYLASEPADAAVVGALNTPLPDQKVMKSGDFYYTNIWNENPDANNPSYATAVDNFTIESNDNLYLFTLDALKDQRDIIYQEGTDLESKPAQLGDNDMYGSLQAMRELLTEEAEFSSEEDIARDPNATTKRGIPFYQHMLDSYAQQFAKMFNDMNQIEAGKLNEVYKIGSAATPPTTDPDTFLAADGGTVNYVVDASTTPPTTAAVSYKAMTELYAKISNPTGMDATNQPYYKDFPKNDESYAQYQKDIQTYQACMDALRDNGKLTEEYDFYDGGILFSNNGNSDDPTGITAANISISHSWSQGAVRVLNTKNPNQFALDENGNPQKIDSRTLNDNIAHIVSVMDQKLEYFTTDTVRDAAPTGKAYFTGTFQEMFDRGPSLLAADAQTTNAQFTFSSINTLSLDNDRMSVSAVDLNEEATDMMKFSQAFSAACQLLTTIDSMLDRLINNTI